MNEFENEKTRFELEAKRHQSELEQFSITEDLAQSLDRVHEKLRDLRVKHQAIRKTYEPHLRDF